MFTNALLKSSSLIMAARPIRINKPALKSSLRNLLKRLPVVLRKYRRNDQIGDVNKLVLLGDLDLSDQTNVYGDSMSTCKVALQVHVDDSPNVWLGGGVGKIRGKESVIVLSVNGRYSVDDVVGAFEKRLFNMVLHEVTHLLDVPRKNKVKVRKGSGLIPTTEDVSPSEYFNDPLEVRAYMQEVVDQVLTIASKIGNHFKGNRLVDVALKNSRTWEEIEEHLNSRNRKLIMKAVYTALQDNGYI